MKKKTAVMFSVVLLSSVITFSATKFTDVNPKDWFYKDVIKASSSGVMMGYVDGEFKPNQYVTRAEMAVITNRMMDLEGNNIQTIINSNKSSGKIISPSGAVSSCIFIATDIILTSNHVTDEFDSGEIIPIFSYDDQVYYGTVVNVDDESDLSLVKLDRESNIPSMKIASEVNVLEDVYAFGSPIGLENTITFGKISNISRSLDNKIMAQFDIQSISGMSGGAIVNKHGELVGVISSKLMNTGITFGSRLVDITDFLHGRKK